MKYDLISQGNEKKILDVTCGSRTIWFNKNHPNAVYCDKREEDMEIARWVNDKAIFKSVGSFDEYIGRKNTPGMMATAR